VEKRTFREIAPSSLEYPALLREIPDPPLRLGVAGRPLEQGPVLAIVGTRKASPYGLEVGERLAAELALLGITVVSGLAHGIDAAAHRGALRVAGSTIAVLGCGLDLCYPARNRDLYRQILSAGTLVSEYPPGTPPLPYHFPVRNRIIAGMSLGVVIVEGKPGGGAMITARLAMEYGREVFAVPGPVHSPGSQGPHLLIREGARLVTCPEDILEDLGLPASRVSTQEPLELCPDEQRVMAELEYEPMLLDSIARKARMPPATVAAVLVGLEMKGQASRLPGGRFARSVSIGLP
jgi:DNA processing protein